MSSGTVPHRVVTLAGHVDHGKSTLVTSLTGMRTDRLAEERRRGLTIELGFTWLDLPPTAEQPGTSTIALVDVPGHERFLSTMVSGAGCAAAALLVCAADEGPSVQTVEHLDVLRLLEIPMLAAVMTKADRVDAERQRTSTQVLRGLLEDAAFSDVPVVPVDARDRDGLAPLLRVLRNRLAVLPSTLDHRRPRLWIDRAFSVEGAGTVVTGTLGGGEMRVGSDAWTLPGGATVRVRRLQSFGHDVDPARAGTRVAVNLGGAGRDRIRRGDALEPLPRHGARTASHSTTTFDALVWHDGRDDSTSGSQLGAARRLHVGTAVSACTVRVIATGDHHGPEDDGLPKGAVAVQVRMATPLPLRTGDRMLLTSTGSRRVSAGGVVCDPHPVNPRGRPARAQHAALVRAVGSAARTGRADDMLRGLLALHGGMRSAAELTTTLGIDADHPDVVDGTLLLGETVALAARLEELPGQLAVLGAHVVSADELAITLVRLGHSRERVEDIVEHLVTSGRLRRTTLGLVVEQHADDAADAREARYSAVAIRIEAQPFDPPDFRTIADEEGLDHRERVQLLASDRLVRCDDVVVGRDAFARAVLILRALDERHEGFTAAQARDALSSTRRVTVPVLEEMARRRLAHFDGTVHRMTPADDA